MDNGLIIDLSDLSFRAFRRLLVAVRDEVEQRKEDDKPEVKGVNMTVDLLIVPNL